VKTGVYPLQTLTSRRDYFGVKVLKHSSLRPRVKRQQVMKSHCGWKPTKIAPMAAPKDSQQVSSPRCAMEEVTYGRKHA